MPLRNNGGALSGVACPEGAIALAARSHRSDRLLRGCALVGTVRVEVYKLARAGYGPPSPLVEHLSPVLIFTSRSSRRFVRVFIHVFVLRRSSIRSTTFNRVLPSTACSPQSSPLSSSSPLRPSRTRRPPTSRSRTRSTLRTLAPVLPRSPRAPPAKVRHPILPFYLSSQG